MNVVEIEFLKKMTNNYLIFIILVLLIGFLSGFIIAQGVQESYRIQYNDLLDEVIVEYSSCVNDYKNQTDLFGSCVIELSDCKQGINILQKELEEGSVKK